MDFSHYTFILLGLVFFLFYIYMTRKFNYWKERNVFYLKPIPFFGNLLPIFKMKQNLGKWLQHLCQQMDHEYFGLFVFDEPILVVQSSKLIRSILQKDSAFFQNRSACEYKNHPILSNFMFFSRNPKWKTVRSKLSPIFTTGKLKMMFQLIQAEGKSLTDYIGRFANLPDIESKEICAKYSTNIIAKCAFAIDAHSFENENSEFRNLGRRVFDFKYSTAFRQFSSFLLPKFASFFNISFVDFNIVNRLSEIFLKVFNVRLQSPKLDRKDLVEVFADAKRSLSDEEFDESEMVGQAIQFFVAGFETVSGILSFTLYELCINHKIQEKLRAEIFEMIEKYKGITYEGVLEMKYLDMCVSETLRKYPVLPYLDRICHADYKVEGTNLVIEKNTPVYIPMFALHYNPKYFPEPSKYDPERFIDKSAINCDGIYYFPFGDGPRNCIGSRFGLLSVKVGLVSILSKYYLEPSGKTPIPLVFELKSLVLQSTVGVPLKFVPLKDGYK